MGVNNQFAPLIICACDVNKKKIVALGHSNYYLLFNQINQNLHIIKIIVKFIYTNTDLFLNRPKKIKIKNKNNQTLVTIDG